MKFPKAPAKAIRISLQKYTQAVIIIDVTILSLVFLTG